MNDPASKNLRSRVVVIDDHTVLNEAITAVVNTIPGCEMAGSAGDESSAIELCQREQPDVILLDLVLSSGSGLSVLEKVKPICPRARVLVFSGNLNARYIRQALAAGAIGVVGKRTSLDEFRAALRAAIAGRPFFCNESSEAIKQIVTQTDDRSSPQLSLSPRQKSILKLVALGLNSRQIAAKLGISVNTVMNHRSLLMKKTGLHGVAQLSVYAADRGLIDAVCRQNPPE